MKFDGPIATARAYSTRTHTAECTVTRPGAGDPVFDPDTGTYTNPADQTVYEGACLVVPTGGERVQQFGEGPVTTREHTVSIADLDTEFRVGDTVSITASRDGTFTLTVMDVPKSELVTVRRLVCEEVL